MPADAPAALVLGERGLLHDVVSGALVAAGITVSDQCGDVAVACDAGAGAPPVATAADGGAPLVVVTSRPLTIDEELDAVRRGAAAVVPADAGVDELVRIVRTVAEGGNALHPALVQRIVVDLRSRAGHEQAVPQLTRREEDILGSIGRGESVKQTAGALGISAKTVENLQSRLYRKLGVRNRAQAVAQAHAAGLL